MKTMQKLNPATLVIFGITGDLARRKLFPALYYLAKQDLLPDTFTILGVTRRGTTADDVIDAVRAMIMQKDGTVDDAALAQLRTSIEIITMDLLNVDDYRALAQRLDAIETQAKVCVSRLYYLAIPAQMFSPVITQLGEGGLNHTCQHGDPSRLLIEKPFGYDTNSAKALISHLHSHFQEEQIYRIDHYLAKETAQNILVFRFQNPLFKHAWDATGISSITITAAEAIDIEGRAAFYEQTGALRDFIQGHLLQLLALATMNQPQELTSDAIHREKLALLRAITPIRADQVHIQAMRGQYAGYRDEVADPHSLTETYAAVKLQIDTPRWKGVPILIRTGKALTSSLVEVVVTFSSPGNTERANVLTFCIQPNAGISLQLSAKEPGFAKKTKEVRMDFSYDTSFEGHNNHPDAYERVLMDAFSGDRTLFTTADEALAAWGIIENVIHEWTKADAPLYNYPKGSWGPEAVGWNTVRWN